MNGREKIGGRCVWKIKVEMAVGNGGASVAVQVWPQSETTVTAELAVALTATAAAAVTAAVKGTAAVRVHWHESAVAVRMVVTKRAHLRRACVGFRCGTGHLPAPHQTSHGVETRSSHASIVTRLFGDCDKIVGVRFVNCYWNWTLDTSNMHCQINSQSTIKIRVGPPPRREVERDGVERSRTECSAV
eukprot:364603-Chlamydomonas_euryale.AAC.1